MIEGKNFLESVPLDINPNSLEYRNYWKEQIVRIIEGHRVGGVWMPPSLYFYVNFWHIELNKKHTDKVKTKGRPLLRDLEWIKHRLYTVARGFSGFENDVEFHCNNELKEAPVYYNKINKTKEVLDDFVDDRKYQLIQYVDPLEYLETRKGDLGLALYENEARNIVDIESRGTGKSYTAAGISGHHFITDGATSYKMWKEEKPKSETLIGAIDTFFSSKLLQKVKYGLEHLPGRTERSGRIYPSPLSKRYTGSYASGKSIVAGYETYSNGAREFKGSGSVIHHRSFKDNHTAANGTRPGLTFLEEVGFFNILLPALGQLKECTMNGATKFGVIWMMGTGGDMEGGSTQAVKEVFHNPEQYDCISFKDIYEDRPNPIGFFVPATYGFNQFKDQNGNTNLEQSSSYLEKVREKLKKGKDKKAYNDELQQRPLVPSEAFLLSSGNIFPTADLQEHLNFLDSCEDDFAKGVNGTLILDETGRVRFEPDLHNKLQPADFPVKEGYQQEGCVTIWGDIPSIEEPPPFGQYIAATDPYNQDQANDSVSLGSTFIYKTTSFDGKLSNYIVAEYTGRPNTASEYYENVRRLCMLFNAVNLYENQFNGMKMHFDHHYSLGYLAYTPTILKSTANTKVARTYGLHMTADIKEELEIFTREWLVKPVGDGKLNLHHLYSKPLLKELIAYNNIGNFDRVIAFMLIVAHKLQNHHLMVEEAKEEAKETFFNRRLYINR